MLDQEANKVLALAAVCQSAALVQGVARYGQMDETAFNASINSIVVTDPESVEQVFGSVSDMRVGLTTLIQQLSNQTDEKDAEITRYVASILGLERKLQRNAKRMQQLAERIANIQRQQTHMSLFEQQMIGNLASVYIDVVSPAGPKIQVAGNPSQLNQTATQQKVRALLLAGVRAAVLWRQLGGQRRQILFRRRKILATAEKLHAQINLI